MGGSAEVNALLVALALVGVLAISTSATVADVQPRGDADGEMLAVSGTGNASCSELFCLAIAGMGEAQGHSAAVSAADGAMCTGPACLAAAGQGQADGGFASVSGQGDASGITSVALDGNASGVMLALSGTGDADGGSLTVAPSGDATHAEVALSGTGTIDGTVGASGSGDVQHPVHRFLPDLFSEPASSQEVDAPWDGDGPGAHAVIHAQTSGDARTVVFGLETLDREPVMHAVVEGEQLYVTDGVEADGELRPLKQVGIWRCCSHRVDVGLEDDTYRVSYYDSYTDQVQEVTARTSTSASQAQLADREQLEAVHGTDRHDVAYGTISFLPAGALTETFRGPLDPGTWTEQITRGDLELQSRGWTGQDIGRFHLEAREDVEDLAYLHTPLEAPDGAYVAEVTYRPRCASLICPDGIGDHQALIAGLSGPVGDPSVNWALVVAPDTERYWEFALHLVGFDGSRTQVSPTWGPLDGLLHHARVLVNEEEHQVTVQVDGAETALAIDLDDLPGTDRVAIGDIWAGHTFWTGGGEGYHSDVTVYPVQDPP